ncbi:MAG TPA: uroporphyrinogen decarboxylase [Candidatus Binataceae bacterium]|nr:uroporphyrinogen decarboxylase [Candidatus Binataceae bacterium]
MDAPSEKQESLTNSGFAGLRVVAFESRMAQEASGLIERHGGVAIVAPSMREVPLGENPAAFAFARRLMAGELDVVIFLTGVGAKALFDVLSGAHSQQALAQALTRLTTVVRGPKPARALRAIGIVPTLEIAEPNTWREVLSELARRTDLAGKRVAVQEYGVSNRDLTAGLEARGASVILVPVYRWALPQDREPLRRALRAIAAGEADLALFTSATQVSHVLQMAEAEGCASAVRRGLGAMVVGSIGPVCSAALREHGLAVDLEPAHPKLGHLIKQAALQATGLLARKRIRPASLSFPAPDRAAAAEPQPGPFADHPMMRACRMAPAPYTPIWLMRQAGRYMPEYRRVREQLSFLEMCGRPEVAAEVTVTAVERLNVDAAIIFADILLPLLPMNVGLHYERGDGPIIDRPIRNLDDLRHIGTVDAAGALGFVGEAIKLARKALAGRVPLIGFAGAPFTLASYMIEGGGSRQYLATKRLMYNAPDVWSELMRMLARVTADYLAMQIAAGADIIQLFDSWVGSLGPDDYRQFVLPYTAEVIRRLPASVPVIHFGTVTGNLLELMREAGGDVIGLDWRVNLDQAWARLGFGVAVQGNLDPIALFAGLEEIRARARTILDQAGGRSGHIFNLGHGILPETPVDHVIALIDMVHEMSRR